MNILNIFNTKKNMKDDDVIIDKNIDDLIFSFSHLKLHSISIALIQAIRVIHFLDPNGKYKSLFNEEHSSIQDQKEIINITKEFLNDANRAYQSNKKNIDLVFKHNIH